MLDFIKNIFSKKDQPDNSVDLPVEPIVEPVTPEVEPVVNETVSAPEITVEEPAPLPTPPVAPPSLIIEEAVKVVQHKPSTVDNGYPVGMTAPLDANSTADTNKAKIQQTAKKAPVSAKLQPMKANLPPKPNVGTDQVKTGSINVGSTFLSTVNAHLEVRNQPDNQGSYVKIKAGLSSKYNDLTTKAYVDAAIDGLTIIATCDAASIGANVNLASDVENGDPLDSFVLFLDQLIIIKDQADPRQNGVYVVSLQNAPTRYPAASLLANNIFYVSQGKINHETFWKVVGTFTGPGGAPNYGVDAINFVPVTLTPGGGGNITITGTNHVAVTNPSTGTFQVGLSASGVMPGTYNTLTVDQYGIVTAGTNSGTPGMGTVTSVDTGTGLVGGPITSAGTISMDVSGVTAGTYGSSTNIPQITVDALGRVTSVTNIITAPTFFWNNVPGTNQLMVANNGYITSNAALTTVKLPVTIPQGAVVAIAGAGAGGWILGQNAGQTIHFGWTDSTTGTAGFLASTNKYDYIELLCIIANTDFIVKASVGNISVT